MRSLGGLIPNSAIRINGKSSVILPLGYRPPEGRAEHGKLIDIALNAGLLPAIAEGVISNLKLKPKELYLDLPMTARLLFDLKVAFAQEPVLVVFSTCGLDPSGVMAVDAEVTTMLKQCSAIDVLSAAWIELYQSPNSFTKVVRCSLLGS
jgi:hypothetical protein